jgi:uncharacterized membrane protein
MAQTSVDRLDAAIRPVQRRPSAGRGSTWLVEHWLAVVTGVLAVFAGLPWLAPVFMKLGWTGPARAIYLAYSFMCHQLPQRSYFLFGREPTYGLEQIGDVWQWQTFVDLRQFIGTPEMGYKVAYAHRLTAIWTSVLVGSLLFGLVRRRLRPLPVRWYLLLMLPMALDGFTHMFTEAGLVDWRITNAWFQPLAQAVGLHVGATFYTSTTVGSLNWVLRTLTGALFGLASVWFAFPHIERGMRNIRRGRDFNQAPVAPGPATPGEAATPV